MADSEAFWAETAKRLDGFRIPTNIKGISFDRLNSHIRWYEGGLRTLTKGGGAN